MTLVITVGDDKVRGAALRLLQNLYVDCEPQTETIVPRFSRSYLDICNGGSYHSSSEASVKFSIFQQVISTQIREYQGKRFDVAIYTFVGISFSRIHSLLFISSVYKFN